MKYRVVEHYNKTADDFISFVCAVIFDNADLVTILTKQSRAEIMQSGTAHYNAVLIVRE